MIKEEFPVIILDEDKKFCNEIEEFFCKKGLKVFAFHHIKQAYNKIMNMSPDIIIVSEEVVGMENGQKFILKLKEDNPHLFNVMEVIFVFNVVTKSDIETIKNMGIKYSFVKPIDYTRLFKSVREIFVNKYYKNMHIFGFSKDQKERTRLEKKFSLQTRNVQVFNELISDAGYIKNHTPIILIIDNTFEKEDVRTFLNNLKIETEEIDVFIVNSDEEKSYFKNEEEKQEFEEIGLTEIIETNIDELYTKLGYYIIEIIVSMTKLGKKVFISPANDFFKHFIEKRNNKKANKEKLKKLKIDDMLGEYDKSAKEKQIKEENCESKIKISNDDNILIIYFEDSELPEDIDTLSKRINQYMDYVNLGGNVKIVMNFSFLNEETFSEKTLKIIFKFYDRKMMTKIKPQNVKIVYKDSPVLKNLLENHHKFYEFEVVPTQENAINKLK